MAAAQALGQSQPTLGRHIDELEHVTGLTFFSRGRSGMMLTEAGLSLLADAQAMATEADRFSLKAAGKAAEIDGPVRITASKVVATFILPDILAALKDAEPGIDIELVATDEVSNLLSRDADIAIRMVRPTQNDLIAVQVNEFAMGAFAHERYLEKFGEPSSMDELINHRLIGYDRNMLIINSMERLGIRGSREMFTFRTDDQVAYWALVKAGAGIGFGSRFVAAQSPYLKRIMPDLPISPLPMWLASHQELKTSLKIRRVMDFLKTSLATLPLAG